MIRNRSHSVRELEILRRQTLATAGVLLAAAAGTLNPFLLLSAVGTGMTAVVQFPGGPATARPSTAAKGTNWVALLFIALLIVSALLLQANNPRA